MKVILLQNTIVAGRRYSVCESVEVDEEFAKKMEDANLAYIEKDPVPEPEPELEAEAEPELEAEPEPELEAEAETEEEPEKQRPRRASGRANK